MGRHSSISQWGPAAWKFMHVVSFTYPNAPTDDDKQNAFDFMHSFANVIPCKMCREEWTGYVQTYLTSTSSTHLQSRHAFSHFLVTGHNFVNRRLQKETISYEEAQALFDPEYTPSSCSSNRTVIAIGTVAVSVLAVLYLMNCHTRGTKRDSPGLSESTLSRPGFRM